MRIIVGIIANALALFATQVVPGIAWNGDVKSLAIAGLVLGVFNLIVRPIAMLLSLPLLILTLGLFYFVLNGLLLMVVDQVLPDYTVAGFVPAVMGAVVLGVVNWAVHALFGTNQKDN